MRLESTGVRIPSHAGVDIAHDAVGPAEDEDRVWRPRAGRATAEAIPGARSIVYPGMGHGALPRELWPTILDEIRALARRAGAAIA